MRKSSGLSNTFGLRQGSDFDAGLRPFWQTGLRRLPSVCQSTANRFAGSRRWVGWFAVVLILPQAANRSISQPQIWYNSVGPYRGVATARQSQNLSVIGPIFNKGKVLQRKGKTMQEILDYIAAHPGAAQGEIVDAFVGRFGRNRTRKNIALLVAAGCIRVEVDGNNRYNHFATGNEYMPEPVPTEEGRRGRGQSPPERKFLYGVKLAGEGAIKIGVSGSMKHRINMMQTSHFRTYYVVFAVLTERHKELERELHNAFADRRLGGEWFDITVAELIAEVESNGYLQ